MAALTMTPLTIPSPTPSLSAAPAAACPLSAEPRSAPPSTALISRSWYEGADGYDRAQRDHAPHRVPTFVYFLTSWCPYCRQFEQDLLTAPAVERFLNSQVIKVRVNPEAGANDRSFAERFGVDGYPTLLLTCEGQAASPLSTHVRRGEDSVLRSPDEFVAEIENAVARCLDNELREAQTQRRAGRTAEAIARLDDVLALQPRMASAYVERALAHVQADATDAALDDLRRAAEIDGDAIAVFDGLDSTLSRQQRWGEIATCWTGLIERQPGNSHALFGRGVARYRGGELERALADMREACRLGEAPACEQVSRLTR
jgi:tetratricopeptide (TPR) repeat protein